MEAAYPRLAPDTLFDRVLAGLGDEHEIKTLSHLMLAKLLALDPAATARRLDPLAERFQATLAAKLKDNAVKQEVEKAQEANRDVLRSTVRLRDRLPGAGAAGKDAGGAWKAYLEWAGREYEQGLSEAAGEVKRQD